MSDENENTIDESFEHSQYLSHDGKAIEAMLESAQLPPSTVNRDVLMYEAGWNAAGATVESTSQHPTALVRPQTPMIWPAMTAVFATAVATLLVMVLQKEPTLEPDRSVAQVAVTDDTNAISDEMPAVVEEALEAQDVQKPVNVFALFDFRPKASYRQRIENYVRDSHRQSTPVVFEGNFEDDDTKRLKTGSFLAAEELVDDLL